MKLVSLRDCFENEVEYEAMFGYFQADYVLKPFDVPQLQELIDNALQAARAMKQVVSYEPLLEK